MNEEIEDAGDFEFAVRVVSVVSAVVSSALGTGGTAWMVKMNFDPAMMRQHMDCAAFGLFGGLMALFVLSSLTALALYNRRHNAHLSLKAASSSLRNLAFTALVIAGIVWLCRH